MLYDVEMVTSTPRPKQWIEFRGPLNSCLLLIPLLPFVGFLVNAFLGKRLPKPVSGGIACLVMLASFAVSAMSVLPASGAGTITCDRADGVHLDRLGRLPDPVHPAARSARRR